MNGFTTRFFSFLTATAAALLSHQATAQATANQAAASDTAAAHCLLLPLPPAQRVALATLVVEAQVLSSRSTWDANHRHLLTRHRLRVFSLLKGSLPDTAALTIITEGGRLGLRQELLTNTLQLQPGQRGVFFLYPAPWKTTPAAPAWAAVGSRQGFIEYHPADGTASEPFRQYPAVDAGFYQEIAALSRQPRRVLRAGPAMPPRPPARGTLAAAITGLAPTQLAAGTGAVLTIAGSGFGNGRGAGFVEFRNADDGGATWTQARADGYLSWTDAQIQVRVPSNGSGGHPAGSGLVRVTAADQSTAISPAPIRVVYALTNVESSDGQLLQRPNHTAGNASGGLSFHFAPNFAASTAATAAWQRALANWRCHTGMNWDVAEAAPNNDIADDGRNTVAFDAGGAVGSDNTLPTNVLGRTTSYYAGCYEASGAVVFRVDEIDMQFSAGANFQFGPALAVAPQIDFETVAVHELGHAQQLSHLILPGAIMHYAVARGQNARTLTAASDIAGGRRVLRERSFRRLGCGGPALLPAPLTSLSASYIAGTGAQLTWTTRDECFLSGFVVERAAGPDTTQWQAVARVTAGQTSYQATDAAAVGALTFYRLGLQRPDGSTDYAAPLPVTGDAVVSLFPNPATGDALQLQYPASRSADLTFRIYDELGRLQQTSFATTQPGLNVLDVNLISLRPGFYLLQYRDEAGKRRALKFVRQ